MVFSFRFRWFMWGCRPWASLFAFCKLLSFNYYTLRKLIESLPIIKQKPGNNNNIFFKSNITLRSLRYLRMEKRKKRWNAIKVWLGYSNLLTEIEWEFISTKNNNIEYLQHNCVAHVKKKHKRLLNRFQEKKQLQFKKLVYRK